jgi:putative drug exporter of the RND superfamily
MKELEILVLPHELSILRRQTRRPQMRDADRLSLTARNTETAVIRGIGRTGRLVTSAALILFLAFTAMASGPGAELTMFATPLAIGILLDATVIRALMVPAVIALMGRWNWWLPRWPARLLGVPSSLPPRPAGRDGEA